ncbi:glutaredoxin family protein [Alkalihalophilus marmarensis]|uniref:YruB family glutaredoxin n=1 Tax=Alkalihalophilus marmarensis DSM 21297 TaxID=1188261 RepID=U6SMZ8_9BACI|nr:glutaredoxin family protein [Alkalihalophilus marmarensis]ERN52963.1 YruB family glutaredoxin [Alkalihalophilus marmarensis DSM 21297]MCM3488959.1 glutaredoxin family protein [Alkalihalophilus marmarensis]
MKGVTVFTTNRCPYCVMLKNFLNEYQISFKEVNVEDKPELMQQLVNTTGQMGVPQTNVDGKWVIGFDPNEIMSLIKKA